jgi:hypothetical protein
MLVATAGERHASQQGETQLSFDRNSAVDRRSGEVLAFAGERRGAGYMATILPGTGAIDFDTPSYLYDPLQGSTAVGTFDATHFSTQSPPVNQRYDFLERVSRNISLAFQTQARSPASII